MSNLEEMYLTEKFGSSITIQDVNNFINENPSQNVPQILKEIYNSHYVSCEKLLYANKYYFINDIKIFVLVLIFIIFLLIGIGIGYNS